MSASALLYQVTVPYACFDLLARSGVIVRAAPIAGWATGKRLVDVTAYYRRRGGSVEEVTA